MKLLPFAAAVLGLLGLLHAYLGSRLVAAALLPRPYALPLLTALLLLSLAALAAGRTGSQGLGARMLAWGGYAWIGTLLLLLAACIVGDLLVLAGHGARLLNPQLPVSFALLRALPLLLALLGAAASLLEARRPPRIYEVEIPIRDLPRSFDGFRIAHLSDTHLSTLLGRDWCERLVARIDSAKPDIVVHTGDLADGPVAALREASAPLAKLPAPRLFVTGNHESYSGLETWKGRARELGFEVLENSSWSLERKGERIVFVGLPDADQGHRLPGTASDPQQAFAHLPEGTRIMLTHQPRTAAALQGHNIALQLSGHTHGGQIWPWHLLVRLQQPANSGYAHIGDTPVFVSRGAGFWGPPMRLFAPAEVPILVLRRSERP